VAAGRSTIDNRWRLREAWDDGSSWRYWVLGLASLALGLRLWNLKTQPFWIDEFTEFLVSSQDLPSILTFHDGFPPLGFLAARGWLEWGSFETARYLAAAYGIVTVGLIGLAALRLGGRRAALFGLLVSGLSPFLVWHSQELRPYSLVMMLAAASLVFLLRASESGRQSDWVVYGIINGLGLWTHYFFALTIGAGMVWLWLRRRDIAGPRGALTAHVVTAAMALPLVALLPGDLGLQVEFQAEVATEDPSRFGIGPLGFVFFSFFSGFSLGPSLRELHEVSVVDALTDWWAWIVVFGVLAGSLAWWVVRWWRDRWVQLLVMLVLGPVLLAGILSVVAGVGFRPRYVSWCIVPLLVLAAVALSRASARAAVAASVVVVLAFGIAYANRHWNDRYGNEDLRAAMAEVEVLDPTSEMPVLVTAGYMAPLASYYAAAGRTVTRVPEVGSDGSGIDAAFVAIEDSAGRQPYFLLYTRSFHGDTGGVLLDGIKAASARAAPLQFAGLQLYLVVPESASG